MTDRRLATIEAIADLAPIPDADSIERARIRGWDVVVKKGEFAVGDPVVYFEVDSLLDVTDSRFAFLEPRGVRTDAEGHKGHVLKTARLRGQYSQGLALPLGEFPELQGHGNHWSDGQDVTDLLGVIKWEPPVPASLAGSVRGMRPGWIPKTDEERIQNIEALLSFSHLAWIATEKIDGSSTSFGYDGEEGGFHVCSRNLDLLEEEGNTLWRLGRDLEIETFLIYCLDHEVMGSRIVLQGESFGEVIQGNPLKIKGQRFAAFNLMVDGLTVPRPKWPVWLQEISVPTLDLSYPSTVEEALAQVETLKSSVSPDRAAEGAVWRCEESHVQTDDGRFLRASWKAVSSRYLLKNDR